MTTFRLQYPEEPPIGTTIITKTGSEFVRINDKWRKTGQHFTNYSWSDILYSYDEVTLVEPEPVEGSLKRHKIVTTHFIVYIGGVWVEYHLLSNGTHVRLIGTPNMENFE